MHVLHEQIRAHAQRPGNAEHGAVVAAPEQHVRPFVGEMRGDAGEDVILGNEIGHLFLQSQKRAENDLEPEAGEVDPALGRAEAVPRSCRARIPYAGQ